MITVTVCVVTYNHEKYIDDCIQSILNQVHDFEIEILIHDDASTDGTTNKIRNWQKRYPDLIFPIIQEVNQYSIEPIIPPKFIFPRARGDYIAMCEGDDYWISSNKLRIQVEKLEQNPATNLCYHPSKIISQDERSVGILGANGRSTKIVPAIEVLKGGGNFIPTCAAMFRASCIPKITDFFSKRSVQFGDYYIQTICAAPNGAVYLPEIMSVYRRGVPGSFTELQKQLNNHEVKYNNQIFIDSLAGLSEFGYAKQDLNLIASQSLAVTALFFLKESDTKTARKLFKKSLIKSKNLTTYKLFLFLSLYIIPINILWVNILNIRRRLVQYIPG